jgi:hypothetical protein
MDMFFSEKTPRGRVALDFSVSFPLHSSRAFECARAMGRSRRGVAGGIMQSDASATSVVQKGNQ